MGELRVSERQRCVETFQQNGPLHEQFPLLLDNGVSVPVPEGVCSQCKSVIAPNMMRGRVSWPIQAVAVIDAAGYCEPCQRMTQIFLRVRPVPGTFRAEVPRGNGGWTYVEVPAPTWWQRLRWRLVQWVAR